MLIDRMKAMPGFLVRRLQQISTATFNEELTEFDLTAVQFAALVAITELPGLDATRLAELFFFDRATIGDVIARLERKGLIARSRGIQDKRIKVLVPTAAAKPLIDACFAHVEAVQTRLLATLTEQERTTFLALMEKIVREAET